MATQQPLDGVTVLDFGQIYNGPYCGFLLAQASPANYPFALLNGNKECITLNIKTPAGQGLLKRLVRSVDVVIENFSPGTMDRYGVGSAASSGP